MKAEKAHAELLKYALSLPGAFEDHPWGETVVKVPVGSKGGKVFAFFGHPEGEFGLSVKLPSSASDALELPNCKPTGYGLGKAGWVSATFAPGADLSMPLLRGWVLESWKAVAPKKLVKSYTGA